eukprot:scaffold20728_cov132-Isochrysis_galbana.AAC.12
MRTSARGHEASMVRLAAPTPPLAAAHPSAAGHARRKATAPCVNACNTCLRDLIGKSGRW